MTEEVAVQDEEVPEPVWINRYGYHDGQRFCLRSFPVWYRWDLTQEEQSSPGAAGSTAKAEGGQSVASDHLSVDGFRPFSEAEAQIRKAILPPMLNRAESGVECGVEWTQTLGQMELSCPLIGEGEGLQEDDLVVELSSWEMRVSVRHYVEGLQRQEHLSGDLFADVHRKLSWWRICEDDGLGSGRRLHISLAKACHKAWQGPWRFRDKNPHRRRVFPIAANLQLGAAEHTCEKMEILPPGDPEDTRKELFAALEPEGLCTGVDDAEEDNQHAYVTVHLDEANLDTATAKVPLEQLFAADVEEESLEVSVAGVGYQLCLGSLVGNCVPELTTWEVQKSLRRKLPPGSGIRAPAFYNPALRIKLVKADNSQGIWGGAFASMNSPEFQRPRERMDWNDVIQRNLVLAPMAPLVTSVKAAEAKKLCTKVELSQDANSACIIMHLHSRLEVFAWKYKLDVATFFAMRVADRVVDMNVLADCEYSMCYGFLGGLCMPEKTSWELVKHEKEEQDASKQVVAASGELTVEQGIALEEELIEGFKKPNFRHRLQALEQILDIKGSAAYRQERQRLVLTVQGKVLPKYGFEPNIDGVAHMARLLGQGTPLGSDERIRALTQQADLLLGSAPPWAAWAAPPLPELAEDPRFIGTWTFQGIISGKFEISKTERPRLVITMSVIGLVMSGNLEPYRPPGLEQKPANGQEAGEAANAPQKDVGPWLQAEVRTADGKKKCGVRLRFDEVLEKIMFDFRRFDQPWIEDFTADLEAKVAKEKIDKSIQEPHLAVHVTVVKAPSSCGRWRNIFRRGEPGDPLPEEEEIEEELEADKEDEEKLTLDDSQKEHIGTSLEKAGSTGPGPRVVELLGPLGEEPALPIALLFPGQGSQYVKMMDTVKYLAPVRAMLSKAEEILGYDLLELCLKGPEEKLEETRYCQPALFVASLAGVERLRTERGEAVARATAVAGLSLGEYTALCVAGVLTFEDGLRLVKLRGEAMHEAACVGKQRMLSVVGMEREWLDEACVEALQADGPNGTCQVANCLFPSCFAVGGTEPAIKALQHLAIQEGAMQAKVLKTAGAFHTPLMAPAEARLEQALEEVLPRMRPPRCTVWMNASAEPVRKGCDPEVVVALLKRQLTSPVLWEQVVLGLLSDGVKEFYEVGPMKQLKAIMKRIDTTAWKAMQNVHV